MNETVLLPHGLEFDALILASPFLFASWSGEAGEVDDFLSFIFSSKYQLRQGGEALLKL